MQRLSEINIFVFFISVFPIKSEKSRPSHSTRARCVCTSWILHYKSWGCSRQSHTSGRQWCCGDSSYSVSKNLNYWYYTGNYKILLATCEVEHFVRDHLKGLPPTEGSFLWAFKFWASHIQLCASLGSFFIFPSSPFQVVWLSNLNTTSIDLKGKMNFQSERICPYFTPFSH